MKTALLATIFLWATIIALTQALMGCTLIRGESFPIDNKISVESIKIEPCKVKSIYRAERNV